MIVIGAALMIAIIGGIIGSRGGDATCACRKKSDSGWMGFSVTWFLVSMAVIILLVIGLGKQIFGFLPMSAISRKMNLNQA